MIQIIRLNGIDRKIYPLVGPLVMNPEILHFNNNYPFKTGEKYEWYIAAIKRKVIAFVPVEHRKKEWIINNYYAQPDKLDEVLPKLIQAIIEDQKAEKDTTLSAVVQNKHLSLFTQEGFEITKSWKVYYKMKKVI